MSLFHTGVLFVWLLILSSLVNARTVVFWQEGFPTLDSTEMTRSSLEKALGDKPVFANLRELTDAATLSSSDLLVLPYGSAFPKEAWDRIHSFLREGGSLLVLGGQPLRSPVSFDAGKFHIEQPQEAYSRAIGILHTYQAPPSSAPQNFAWKDGYEFLPSLTARPAKVFVLESHRLDGLGYMMNHEREKVSSPAVVADHLGVTAGPMLGARWVFLDFEPASGFWDSPDGITLMKTAAEYARQGSASFSIQLQFSAVQKGESPQAIVHFRNAVRGRMREPGKGEIELDLRSGDKVLKTERLPCAGGALDSPILLGNNLPVGFYSLRGTYRQGDRAEEAYENGFWVGDESSLKNNPALGVKGDFLTRDGKPFFPFGTNYFSTESNGWDFSGPRNAAVWERDFADMQKHGVRFVRTGVWGGQMKITDGADGAVSERFLRNVEAYLLSAHRHGIAVNFTFFAFDPQSTLRGGGDNPVMSLPGTNPYLDPVTIRAEQNYMLSIVNRFKDDPSLSWDLINEPSFSNPHALWHGNTPQNDPAEMSAWHGWLRAHYGTPEKLAAAWSVTPEQVRNFDAVPLPESRDLNLDLEHGTGGMARAYDYNLFAQDSFSNWAKTMVTAIRGAGSTQLIDVGQDEGGVENRVLNQFYGHSGVSFTTNHTYRQNQNLLWDSLASKVPGIPNIVGETGYQPVTYPDGSWHFDELTGFNLIEQKWAAGFAAGTSGALSWDWDREIYFGMERSDGSAKTWEGLMRDMGAFAVQAEKYATGIVTPQVAIVLPQSLQLSVFNRLSMEAQQKSVRALYGVARSEAYAVGEDQIESLGDPKLIILPSPWILTQHAWDALLEHVRNGATLLVSGRFDLDEHFHPTERGEALGVAYRPELLSLSGNQIKWPEGEAMLSYGGGKTDYLQRAEFAPGETFVRKQLGKGSVLLVGLPLELNDNLQAIGEVYKFALKTAGVASTYTTPVQSADVLISSTHFPDATLYVVSSQTTAQDVSFRDERSATSFSAHLGAGRAALLLVGNNGRTLAAYNWQ